MSVEFSHEDVIDDQPRISVMLADEPGDDREGLLPSAALQHPVRVSFASWENSMPGPQWPETLTLYDGRDQVIGSRAWTAPIEADDYWLDVDMSRWADGPERLYYRVQIFNGAVSRSQPLNVFLDRQPPSLGGAVELPTEVIAGGLTARYLETHGDTLAIGLPDYSDSRPGDTVQLFWDAELYDDTLVHAWRLRLSDLGGPLSLPLAGEPIRAQGDGTRYVHYRVVDRAGNLSADSRMVALRVEAAPVPRSLRAPIVEQASGSDGRQTLRPGDALDGVTLRIPTDATIYPQETLWMQWAARGATGGWTSEKIAGSQRWVFEVPKTCIGAHLGKDIDVVYHLSTPDGEITSTPCRLTVQNAASDLFTTLRVIQATESGELKLSSVPSGADLVLPAWSLISTDQRVRIELEGTSSDGYAEAFVVVASREVTSTELSTGLAGMKVSQRQLSRLRVNTNITFMVYVSFDRGLTWPAEANFPKLRLTLRA